MADGRSRKWRWGLAVAVVLLLVIASAAWPFLHGPPTGRYEHSYLAGLDATAGDSVVVDDATEAAIAAFCGDCHGVPRAECFPRDRWHYEVRKGYEFYARSGRDDLQPPPIAQTVAYYRAKASEQIQYPLPAEAREELSTEFQVERFPADPHNEFPPEFSNFCWAPLVPEAPASLLACEMRLGLVAAVNLREPHPLPQPLVRLNNPTHVETCDLDGDQAVDILIADQGDYSPYDHHRGQVVWLRPVPGVQQSYESAVIAENLARVADVQPADFDGDGDLDLVIAEFGWRTTGGITLLRNEAGRDERPRFVAEPIDDRPGAIHVPVCDFNGDGLPDFAAVISQEYETVEVFVNQGGAHFRSYTLWSGPDPMFGSSGIALADLDSDGDQDILYTNGDAFDNSYVDPSHGVQWLENKGGMQFAYHRLTDLLGAYRALAADVDLDGDQDIIAVSYLPPKVMPDNVRAEPLASIVCLEQKLPGIFARHTLETGRTDYATLQVADFDGDGDPDFVVGPGPHIRRKEGGAYWLSVWWNQQVPRP